MTTWNNSGYPPPGGYPNQQYPGGPQGYPGAPPPQGYPGAPPPQGYPGGPPPQGYPGGPPPQGYPGGPPPQGYPAGGYPQPGFQPGFAPPPPDHSYGGGGYEQPQPGEATPLPIRSDMYGTPYAGGEDDIKGFDFSDQTIRRGFIRKVYAILMSQLLVTTAFIAWFLFHLPTKQFVQRNPALFFVALAIMIVTLLAMACCDSVRRKSPMNFIFLFLFTIAESFMLGVTASRFNSQEVILAVGITAGVCLALTLFAFQTKWDFTAMGGILFVVLIVFILFGIIAAFFPGKTLTLVYASLGALIFSVYLVYDTQLMLGGKHKYSISPEEYIFAALNLYLDVINIFLYILTIIGAARD
ncbi:protein lifeguard 1 isoform X1 [Onthophagus taurus]|uniref:protein lifeguard 1 isoform X1 n=2 Tax=Onthophagus taurus TaxID=166361 RepID=UPI0039BE200D